MGRDALIIGFHRNAVDPKKTVFGVRGSIQTQETRTLKYIPVIGTGGNSDFTFHCYAVPGTDLFQERWLIAREWTAGGTLPIGSFDFADGGNDYFNKIAEGAETSPNQTTLGAYTYS